MRYFDTSVVFSLYMNETRTTSVDIELRKNLSDVIISPWVDIELKSALSLGVRSGRLSLQDAQTALTSYQNDRLQGRYNLQVIDTGILSPPNNRSRLTTRYARATACI